METRQQEVRQQSRQPRKETRQQEMRQQPAGRSSRQPRKQQTSRRSKGSRIKRGRNELFKGRN